jgi:hypothetical protein
MEKWSR